MAYGDEVSFSGFLGYRAAAFIMNDPEMREGLGDAFYTLRVTGQQVANYLICGGRLATFFIHKARRAPDGLTGCRQDGSAPSIWRDGPDRSRAPHTISLRRMPADIIICCAAMGVAEGLQAGLKQRLVRWLAGQNGAAVEYTVSSSPLEVVEIVDSRSAPLSAKHYRSWPRLA